MQRTVEGYVRNINTQESTFVLQAHVSITCLYKNIFDIKPYQLVSVSGTYSKNYFDVDTVISKDITMTLELRKEYEKMARTITNPKNLAKLTKKYVTNPPSVVKKILVLTGSDSQLAVSCFVTDYETECSGKLDIYHMNQKDLQDIQTVLARFTDYDMIVWLCEDLTKVEICLLSSRENIKYLVSRQRGTYLAMVRCPDKDKPLIEYFCNRVFDDNVSCIEFISNIQSEQCIKIDQLSKSLVKDALDLIAKYRNRIDKYKRTRYEIITPEQVKAQLWNQITQLKLFVTSYCAEILLDMSDNVPTYHLAKGFVDDHSWDGEELHLSPIPDKYGSVVEINTEEQNCVEETYVAAKEFKSEMPYVSFETIQEFKAEKSYDQLEEAIEPEKLDSIEPEKLSSPVPHVALGEHWADKYLMHVDELRCDLQKMRALEQVIWETCALIRQTVLRLE